MKIRGSLFILASLRFLVRLVTMKGIASSRMVSLKLASTKVDVSEGTMVQQTDVIGYEFGVRGSAVESAVTS